MSADPAVLIPLTGVRGAGVLMSVDQGDALWIAKMPWHLSPQGYAMTNIRGAKVALHRLLMGRRNGSMDVDHINRDKLDNRKANLRWTPRSGNVANTPTRKDAISGLKGVRRYDGLTGPRWRASIRRGGQSVHLGSFSTAEEAVAVFKAAHAEIYGEV